MITIEVASYNAHPLPQPIRAEFGDGGGSIGRAPENTLVLLDPDRKISRTHATIVHIGDGFMLRDHGSVVPVVVNGQPLGNGREAALRDGDEIRIGGYVMSVRETAVPAAGALPAAEEALPAEPPASDMAAPVLSWEHAQKEGADARITTVILSASAPETPPSPSSGESQAASAEPTAAQSASEVPPPPAVAAVPAAPASGDELMRALLKGAGLRDMEIPGGLTPQLMCQLGQILREATRGLLDLLAARADTKRHVRADMTVIVASDNNPLKFAPGMDAALQHLLVPRGRGFMPPLRAVDDAYEDLRAHQLGFMAGMRSALTVVLSRFDPKELERRMSETTVADSLLPTHRKAKLWDLFGGHYAGIAKEAESDLHSLFGQEFLKAYQAHAAKLPDGSGTRETRP